MLSDAHCHLDGYPEDQRDVVVERARAAGLEVIVTTGMNLDSSAEGISLAQGYDIVYPAIGIHPWEAIDPGDSVVARLRELASLPKVAAISEVGLDYARNSGSEEVQRHLLAAEVRIAREKNLPLMVHSRESHDDILAILKDEGEGEITGAIHGFSGDSAMLRDWLDLGFFVSIGRGIFRPDSEAMLAIIKDIPQDRLLIETDAVPGYSVAGESPEPAGVKAVADKIGEAMGISGDRVGEIATKNLKSLLNL